jgi:hypothetical protein
LQAKEMVVSVGELTFEQAEICMDVKKGWKHYFFRDMSFLFHVQEFDV